MENSLFQIGRMAYTSVQQQDAAGLDEVVLGAEALYEIAQELRRRVQ